MRCVQCVVQGACAWMVGEMYRTRCAELRHTPNAYAIRRVTGKSTNIKSSRGLGFLTSDITSTVYDDNQQYLSVQYFGSFLQYMEGVINGTLAPPASSSIYPYFVDWYNSVGDQNVRQQQISYESSFYSVYPFFDPTNAAYLTGVMICGCSSLLCPYVMA